MQLWSFWHHGMAMAGCPRLRRPSAVWLLFLLLFGLRSAPAEQLPIRAYTTADGLAHNQINRIVRDSRGFLWFCTAEGLSRFDGYSFTNYGTDQGLPVQNVTDLLETRSGEYWVGTSGGLVRFNPRGTPAGRVVFAGDASAGARPMFEVVPAPDRDRWSNAVTVIREGRDGTLWCGTWRGLCRLDCAEARLLLRPVEIGIPSGFGLDLRMVADLLEDRHGTLWAATGAGLYRRWTDGRTARYARIDGLPDQSIHDLLEDRAGRLWAATRHAGFFEFAADATGRPPAVMRTFSVREGLPSPWVFRLFQASDGRFWVGSNKGLLEFFPAGRPGAWFRGYGSGNGLSFQEVSEIGEDSGGNLWLGTPIAGLMKLTRNGFITYGEKDGILGVHGLFEDGEGGVCLRGIVLGDERRSVFEGARLDRGRTFDSYFQRFGRVEGGRIVWLRLGAFDDAELGWVSERTALRSRSGEWWIGTGVGLCRFPPVDFAGLRTARPLAVYRGGAYGQVLRVFEDSRGDIWASGGIASSKAGPNGPVRWERAGGILRDLAGLEGLPSPTEDRARSFAEDCAGNVWIGFGAGASRFRDGRFTFFAVNEGGRRDAIHWIHSDRAGRLWLASAGSGLIRVDEPDAEQPVFRSYTVADGLSSNLVNVLAEDLDGRIYAGTGRGLDRLDPQTGRIRHFTTADGLAAGAVLSALRDRDGILWFGSAKGLSRFAAARDDPAGPPPVVITGAHVAGAPRGVSALGEREMSLGDLAPDRSRIRLDFVGLSFSAGQALRYQYRLEGATAAGWSAPGEQRTIEFASLAPGRYRFLVRAVNSDGLASVRPAEVGFTILSPVWRRGWFLALAAIAAFAVALALHRYRLARILEIAEMRARIATDLHDDIGANLTKISILSEVARRQVGNAGDEEGAPLSAVARIARESVASMSDIVWAIHPERDTLRDMVRRMRRHAEELFADGNVQLVFSAPQAESDARLHVSVRRDFFLVFKEAVNNAARHSRCSRVDIELGVSGRWLELRVRDDGAGFDPAARREGQGLASMRRRASRLGGEFAVDSRPGGGTTVRLRVPGARPASTRR